MSHPMEGYLDGMRADRAHVWARRDRVEAAIADVPLSAFTVAQLPALLLLVDRRAVSERRSALLEALTLLERIIETRHVPMTPKKRKALEAAGWVFGSAAKFLGSHKQPKLKRKPRTRSTP